MTVKHKTIKNITHYWQQNKENTIERLTRANLKMTKSIALIKLEV